MSAETRRPRPRPRPAPPRSERSEARRESVPWDGGCPAGIAPIRATRSSGIGCVAGGAQRGSHPAAPLARPSTLRPGDPAMKNRRTPSAGVRASLRASRRIRSRTTWCPDRRDPGRAAAVPGHRLAPASLRSLRGGAGRGPRSWFVAVWAHPVAERGNTPGGPLGPGATQPGDPWLDGARGGRDPVSPHPRNPGQTCSRSRPGSRARVRDVRLRSTRDGSGTGPAPVARARRSRGPAMGEGRGPRRRHPPPRWPGARARQPRASAVSASPTRTTVGLRARPVGNP